MKYPNRIELTLLFFILIGAVLRFWNIGFQQMNYDELFTIGIAGPAWNLILMVVNILTFDFTPPFYYLAAHFSMLVFGATAEAIRYPSAICGVLLIPAMYLVGKEYRDDLFGLLLAGFTTIFYNGIYYSKFGRAYSMELLFFSMAFYFFMRAVVKGDNISKLWFSLFALCCVWTHLFSVIPIGIMVLYLAWFTFITPMGYMKYGTEGFLWLAIFIAGCIPLLNYVPLVLGRYIDFVSFGAPLRDILFLIPLDIFTYSVFILFPLALWSLWKHRDERVIGIISVLCITTWVAMVVLSFKTQIILHYALPVTVPLIMMALLPFYEALKEHRFYFHHAITIMVIMVLELVQINALLTIQRVYG